MNENKFVYKVNGKAISLDIDPDYVALQFDEPSHKSLRSKFVTENNHLGEFSDRMEIPGEKFTIFKLAEVQKERVHRFKSAFSDLNNSKFINKAVPVFKMGNKKIIATNKIMVSFGKSSKAKAKDIINKYNCKEIEAKYNEYLLKIPDDTDLFNLIKKIEKEPCVEYVEPDFITIGSNSNRRIKSMSPSLHEIDDTKDLSSQQYTIKITKAEEAWQLQKGNANIKIAILDEGVEAKHPDLDTIVIKSYDATDDDEYQEPNAWDGHGTACCGLAAAKHKHFGIKGLSAGCTTYAVRLAYSNSPGSDWVTSNSIIKRAIDWSWENGADILSNSWGGGAPSNAISSAFERARINGRNGKGCVIIIAAGNEDAIVAYPGNLSEVLTVAASNEYDEPKTKFSRDGEHWWGSCYGPEVDIAAPGVHNLTTDISGDKGYNNKYNYTDFNGTSSATPIVAGIAGLLLSAKPNLTEKQVRTIIKDTADKVGNVPYHEGHNDRMGFGRVNALTAVKAVLEITAEKNQRNHKNSTMKTKN